MPKDSVNEGSDRDLTFEEIQQQEPLRHKLLERWQDFRVKGIYTAGAGIGTILGAWSFQTQFSEASGASDSISQMPIFFIAAIVIGSIITLIGGYLFAVGQISIHKSYRDFDKAMAKILANEQSNSNPSTNSLHSERF
jgi:hypothetical protein